MRLQTYLVNPLPFVLIANRHPSQQDLRSSNISIRQLATDEWQPFGPLNILHPSSQKTRRLRMERVAMVIHTVYPNTAVGQSIDALAHQASTSAFHHQSAHNEKLKEVRHILHDDE
jgi:hypothetical protein